MMPTSKAGKSARGGFTLVELAVVVFIVSLVLALALPSIRLTDRGALKSDARRMASILRHINDYAVAKKTAIDITFDISAGSVHWSEGGSQKDEELSSMRYVMIPSRGEVRDGQLTVEFGPLGAPEDLSVALSEGDKSLLVTLNWISGRVKITEPSEEGRTASASESVNANTNTAIHAGSSIPFSSWSIDEIV